jgi:sugar/nucleoside kinase (ribokinase family)
VSVDLACCELAFLDLTFVGLDAVPGRGEERLASDLLRSPGGGAITAIGAARLGLGVALVSPLGGDPEGDFLRAALAAEGVRWAGHTVPRSAVTVVLPADGERSMATYDPGNDLRAEELAAVAPRAVVASLPRVPLVPPGADLYATVGDADARAGVRADITGARALIVNEREAELLTGAGDPAAAARQLARDTPCAVVTLGEAGAVAATGSDLISAPGIPVEPVDTTGAGDLFTAAYVWADQRAVPLEERLRWAVLYGSLSVRVPTAVAGAETEAALVAAGTRHRLALPAGTVHIKEEVR